MSRVALSLMFVFCIACGMAWAQDPPGATPDQPGISVGGADVRSPAPGSVARPAEPSIGRQNPARRPGQPPMGWPGGQPGGPQPGASTVGRPVQPSAAWPGGQPIGPQPGMPLVRRPPGVPVPPYETVVCPLESSPAADVSKTLNDLLRALSVLEQLRSDVVVLPEVVSNSLVISATPEDLEKVTRLVRQLDRPRPSVRVEVLIAEVQQDGQPTGGPPERSSGDAAPGAAWAGFDLGEQTAEPPAVAKLLEQLGGASPEDSATTVPRRIRALAGSGQLKVLSRAQVTTADNQPAFIHVSRRIPVPRATATTAAGGRTMSMSYEETGVIVGITPRISRGGRVAMEINVEKSGLGSAAPGGGAYEQMPNPPTARSPGGPPGAPDPGNVPRPPQNESIRLQTTVNLADGESTVIGGLAVESQPRQSKLVIVVTPHIIPPKE